MATFTKFLSSFDPDSNTKGKQFEHFVKWFLKNDPKWSTQVDKIWLWDQYPKRWGPDCGIDLVFTHRNGDIWAVQAKCYSPENTISKPDIDKFLNESDRRGINKRLLIATTDKINSNAKQVCDSKEERPVTRYIFSDFDKSAIDYPSHISKLKTAKRKKKPSPRKHQLKAIDAVAQGFKKNDRGQLIMACGTGKTFTTLWVKERISANSTLVLLPSLSLLSQTLREWTFAATKPFDTLCVCSDKSVSKKSDEDEVIHSVKEVPFPVTSDTKEISTFLKGKGRKVIFSTYQSSPLIEESQRKRGVPEFDLVIADEAHRCAGKIGTEFTTVLNEKKIKARKRLFATATPRTYSVSLKKCASEKGVEITDMGDEEVFGKEFFKLNFGEAIELGLLTDYQVIIVGVDDPMIGEWIESRKLVTTNSGDITDAESLANQIGLIKAIKKYDLQRMISFHSRIKRAKEFSSNLQDAIDVIPKKHRPKGSIWTDFVSGEMTAYDRRLKLGQLKELPGDRGLLSNSKCLSEGVDVPSLDGVAFIDPKSSPTDIVQAVGRAIRLSKDKKVGTIVLPVFIKDGENAEASIESSNFKPVWNVLNALKSHDDVFSFELDQLRTELGKRRKIGGGKKGFSKITFDLPESIDTTFSNSLKTCLVEQTTASWHFWFGLLEDFVEHEGSARISSKYEIGGYLLGSWVGNQRTRKKNTDLPEHQRKAIGILSKEQIERLESLKGWVWDSFVDDWERGFSCLQRYISREGHARVPATHKEDSYLLGRWVNTQRIRKRNADLPEHQRTKNSILSKEQIERLESLKGWVWDPFEDDWERGFSCLQRYISREGHPMVPQTHKEDGYLLGNWVSNQRARKKNTDLPEHQRKAIGILSKEQIERLESLKGWVWDPLVDDWERGFSCLQRYISREGHARVPAAHKEDGSLLGNWVSAQRTRKKNTDLPEHQRTKNSILSKEQIERLESLKGWVWDPLVDDWERGFSCLEKYIFREGHARVPVRHKEDCYSLGSWVSAQRTRKKNADLPEHQRTKKGILSKEQIERLESLKGWVWDPLVDDWERGFSCLQRYISREGHARVPAAHKEDGYLLGRWVNAQRTRKKNADLPEHQRKAIGILSKEQIERLESLKGWVWDPFEDDWERGFSCLQRYISREGHARVPFIHKEDSCSLGSWVNTQRTRKKNTDLPEHQRTKNSILSKEQIERLESLKGWVWDPLVDDWERGFSCLQRYISREGHARVPVRHKEDCYLIGNWVTAQRKRKKNADLPEHQRTKKGILSKEQIERLESLKGWVWVVKN